ncbi:hypothetical protein [Streptomyces sp. H34-S4]|uniref:hypothetical protein n=1 Tax=Streptomyces sp. H34-S4 TaxID=2996463 RepID=UPI00226EAD6D|nr:hypothetical protein [Streptomyces sp. H34-S4]MCY0933811.1 hypothetical protein [Streptomyces sp. H34-S4]
MLSLPSTTPPANAPTSIDHRVETVTGHDIDSLWTYLDRGLLDEPLRRLAEAHRALSDAERGVTFNRTRLQRLASGDLPFDQGLFTRIERTVAQLKDATGTRDIRQGQAVAVLEALEAAAPARATRQGADLLAHEFAALLAISQGAKLHQNLQTGRMSVVTASGVRVAHPLYQRLEDARLVARDSSRPLHAGQPISLTDSGRTTLTGTARPPVTTATPAPRAGSWPVAPTRPR